MVLIRNDGFKQKSCERKTDKEKRTRRNIFDTHANEWRDLHSNERRKKNTPNG